MNCEICGNRIVGRPTQVTVERTLLSVCQECSRFGTVVDKKTAITIERTAPKPGPKKYVPKPVRKDQFEEFVLIENYGAAIKKARESLNLTRDAFAQKLGERESVIRRIEAEEMYPTSDLTRRMERLLKIALKATYDSSVKGSTPTPGTMTLGDIAVVKEAKNN